jgi:S-phase kinase-associated protein 1
MATERLIELHSSDKQSFKVTEEVAYQSEMIKNMLEELDDPSAAVPVPNVDGETLSKVLEYCKHHSQVAKELAAEQDEAKKRSKERELQQWDKQYITVDQAVLYHVIMAANYLNIKNLLDLCCQTVADIIKGKTPEEIRAYFKIENDFTPEEEEEVRRENQWAFE